MSGRLVVCATPIGNLGDVTLRVLDILRGADAVIAEDTRVTRRLLARYAIERGLERYDEHVADARTPELLVRMRSGQTLALVSDAGTPGISDPGARLVDACIEAGIPVDVLPGPSAILTALVASGLPTHAFYFGGFLPRKEGERRQLLAAVERLDATLIFYESPRRAAAALAALAAALPRRRAALARELTKVHEEVIRGPIEHVAAEVAKRDELKGEVVLLVGPPSAGDSGFDADAIRHRLEELKASGLSSRDAVRRVAEDEHLPRNVVYGIAHCERTGPERIPAGRRGARQGSDASDPSTSS
jgi:16S rRNA (cytidine1402-2'-O)-methyltransferase